VRGSLLLVALFLTAALVAAGCTSGGAGAATIPFDATGSVVPGSTGTPLAPASPTPTSIATFPLTLTDDEGGLVSLDARPERIVSLTPATTEILFALGASDRVVATTDFDDYPPEAVALPDVATYSSVDVEKIVGLEPDLVIAGGNNFNPAEAVEQLRSISSRRIPVLVVYAEDVAGVLADIELVGTAIGEEEAAVRMTDAMRSQIEAVASATAGLARPHTFCRLGATRDLQASRRFVRRRDDRLAGGGPVTTGSPTVFSISLERLVAADPEVIVLGDANYGVTAADVVARPGWADMAAVTAGAIRPVDDIVVTRPGPRLVEGLRALVRAIHPDATLPPAP
jgi:iron complex transport system substrate-binding protein